MICDRKELNDCLGLLLAIEACNHLDPMVAPLSVALGWSAGSWGNFVELGDND
jgi:hypothetical protein